MVALVLYEELQYNKGKCIPFFFFMLPSLTNSSLFIEFKIIDANCVFCFVMNFLSYSYALHYYALFFSFMKNSSFETSYTFQLNRRYSSSSSFIIINNPHFSLVSICNQDWFVLFTEHPPENSLFSLADTSKDNLLVLIQKFSTVLLFNFLQTSFLFLIAAFIFSAVLCWSLSFFFQIFFATHHD